MRISKQVLLISLICILVTSAASSQEFSRQEVLHGKLTSMRSSFDVNSYEITLKVEPAKKFISGKNEIGFTCIKSIEKIQLDLNYRMGIDSILHENQRLSFVRDSNVFYVSFKRKLNKLESTKLTIYFSGKPREAIKAPWDGGFVWSHDTAGTPWVGLACEGIGASIWLPCKDHLSDEAEMMTMHLIVPENLVGVSNGKKIGEKNLGNSFKQYDWLVSNTINNYDITVNIGDYEHLHDIYKSNSFGNLNLDYYVLKTGIEKAAIHFQQVKKMHKSFEDHFGIYPFWNDGYKLVDAPFWGMEHQSCVAYGNNFENNKWGFDFIIIHESAHEWFGNSISCNDPAEMWIHESFTTYTETVFVEDVFGYQKAIQYIGEQKRLIKNKEPMIGKFGVYYHNFKDNDIYYKGAWMLQTMRTIINNDTLWFNSLRDYASKYRKQSVTTFQILKFFNERTGINWDNFFVQYLFYPALPVFEFKLIERENKLELLCRLKSDVKGLEMPIKVALSLSGFETVYVNSKWQSFDLNYLDPGEFKIKADLMLIGQKRMK